MADWLLLSYLWADKVLGYIKTNQPFQKQQLVILFESQP